MSKLRAAVRSTVAGHHGEPGLRDWTLDYIVAVERYARWLEVAPGLSIGGDVKLPYRQPRFGRRTTAMPGCSKTEVLRPSAEMEGYVILRYFNVAGADPQARSLAERERLAALLGM